MDLVTSASATPSDRIEQAEAEVRGYCGWHIAPSRTEAVVVEGDGSSVLLLPSLHVTAVASVTDEDGNAVTDWKARRNGILRRLGGWREGVEYTVTVTHGYDEAPAELGGIVQAIAASEQGMGFMKTRAMGPFSATFEAPAHQAVLDRYKLPPRP